mmetsp:Transcript_50101/g.103147  ORF Transcript_50101/g.103147 Transcript_50101/m.103147 type:complete len:401 (+) Transcript_50101:357-1559(+)
MISAKSLIAALLVGTIAVDGFAPKSSVSSTFNRLFAEGETKSIPLPPWKGGHKESYPDWSYPVAKPDMSGEEMLKNLDNIDKITRCQKILWPEFSWLSRIGDESSRVYVCFAQDVSRIGYDDEGKIWSLVCPQRGISLATFGTAFVEVTVTGVRGWVDEENRSCYADISVEGNMWIEPQLGNPLVKAFAEVFNKIAPGAPFPFSKEHAVKVDAHQVGKPYEKIWPMTNGTDPSIFQPLAHRHYDDGAYTAYHLEVEMGKRLSKGRPLVDLFDQLVLDLFNMASGDILQDGQTVSWNVWPTTPEGVDTKEWEGHAEKWFNSMHYKHQYPDGNSINKRELSYADGSPFESKAELRVAIDKIEQFVEDAKEIIDEEKHEIMAKHPVLSFLTHHLLKKRTDHHL